MGINFIVKLLFVLLASSFSSAHANVVSLGKSETLLDLDGKAFDLSSLGTYQAVVLVAHGSACPVMRQNYPAFKELAAAFKAKSVKFVFINPLTTDSNTRLKDEVAKYDLSSELFLTESKQEILIATGLRTVGESALLIPKVGGRWEIVFRGGISDRVNFDRANEKPSKKYLENALVDVLKKRPVKVALAASILASISIFCRLCGNV